MTNNMILVRPTINITNAINIIRKHFICAEFLKIILFINVPLSTSFSC